MRVDRAVIELNFEVVPSRSFGDEMVFICPQPGCGDRSGNRSVNVKTGRTNCWRCNVAGDFFRWAKKLGYEIRPGEDQSSSTVEDLTGLMNVPEKRILAPVRTDIRLPQGCHRVADDLKSAYARAIQRMAEAKRLTMEDMVAADVMFTRLDPLWEPYAIFPIYEWGRLVLFQGRLVKNDPEKLGKRFPSSKLVKFGSKYWVYNLDALRTGGHTAIVVESILNVISLNKKIKEEGIEGVVPVCIFKHFISRPQAIKILGCRHLQEICFMYDADATSSSWKQAVELSNYKRSTVAVIQPKPGQPTLDANDDVDHAWEAFMNRAKASASQSLLSMF
jgi:hypothetical protein